MITSSERARRRRGDRRNVRVQNVVEHLAPQGGERRTIERLKRLAASLQPTRQPPHAGAEGERAATVSGESQPLSWRAAAARAMRDEFRSGERRQGECADVRVTEGPEARQLRRAREVQLREPRGSRCARALVPEFAEREHRRAAYPWSGSADTRGMRSNVPQAELCDRVDRSRTSLQGPRSRVTGQPPPRSTQGPLLRAHSSSSRPPRARGAATPALLPWMDSPHPHDDVRRGRGRRCVEHRGQEVLVCARRGTPAAPPEPENRSDAAGGHLVSYPLTTTFVQPGEPLDLIVRVWGAPGPLRRARRRRERLLPGPPLRSPRACSRAPTPPTVLAPSPASGRAADSRARVRDLEHRIAEAHARIAALERWLDGAVVLDPQRLARHRARHGLAQRHLPRDARSSPSPSGACAAPAVGTLHAHVHAFGRRAARCSTGRAQVSGTLPCVAADDVFLAGGRSRSSPSRAPTRSSTWVDGAGTKGEDWACGSKSSRAAALRQRPGERPGWAIDARRAPRHRLLARDGLVERRGPPAARPREGSSASASPATAARWRSSTATSASPRAGRSTRSSGSARDRTRVLPRVRGAGPGARALRADAPWRPAVDRRERGLGGAGDLRDAAPHRERRGLGRPRARRAQRAALRRPPRADRRDRDRCARQRVAPRGRAAGAGPGARCAAARTT